MSGAGFKQADLDPIPFDAADDAPGVRQSFYPRVKLRRALPVKIGTSDGDFSASVRQLSLGGGICSCEHRLLSKATISERASRRNSFAARLRSPILMRMVEGVPGDSRMPFGLRVPSSYPRRPSRAVKRHSILNALIGEMDAARFAGIMAAKKEQIASAPAATLSARGSHQETPYN